VRALRPGAAVSIAPVVAVDAGRIQRHGCLAARTDRLARITRILVAVGALTAAAGPVAGSLVALAQRLGPLGEPVLRVIGR
jgi:hypothetical protein